MSAEPGLTNPEGYRPPLSVTGYPEGRRDGGSLWPDRQENQKSGFSREISALDTSIWFGI